MSMIRNVASLAMAAGLLASGAASAAVVSVSGFAGPWVPSVAGNPAFGIGDNTAASSLAVNAGDTLTITYQSGLTGAFGGGPPAVDALGYVGSIFGSGSGFTGIGSSGTYFPSHAIDPANVGSPIYLNALIGDFVDASGLVLGVFAPGDGPFTITAPTGSVRLQLGINDDIFNDNSGALNVLVTGASGVVEPQTWAIMILGMGLAGLALRRRTRQAGRFSA